MLNEDMSRLCGQIATLRQERRALIEALARGHKARQRAVVEFCSHCRTAQAGLARKARGERLAGWRSRRRVVHAERREVQADLAGVRQFWVGRSA